MTKKAQVSDTLLVLGDLHAPYHHRDAFDFMEAIIEIHGPDRIVHIGDEVDWSSQSYHEKVPSLANATTEFMQNRYWMQSLKDLAPVMDVIHSNHGNLPARKAQSIGFPQEFLKSKNELYDIDEGWNYVFDLTVKLPRGESVYLHHGKSANVVNLSKIVGTHAIQGHYHSKMGITYYGTPERTMWAAQTGCLINEDSMAMAYARNTLAKPMLGSLVVHDGIPSVLPMKLKKSGRWDGSVPN